MLQLLHHIINNCFMCLSFRLVGFASKITMMACLLMNFHVVLEQRIFYTFLGKYWLYGKRKSHLHIPKGENTSYKYLQWDPEENFKK